MIVTPDSYRKLVEEDLRYAAMTEQYIIAWESMTTGKRGQGSSASSLHDAEAICRDLNATYPTIEHWPTPVISEPAVGDLNVGIFSDLTASDRSDAQG